MNNAKSFISKLLYNKFLWQLIFSAFLIGTSVFFIRHENVELVRIKAQLAQSNSLFVLTGVFLTGIYIIFQGEMYIHSYLSMGIDIPLKTALRMFLKRNLLSVFLPAGGFSSLVFFTGEVESRGATKSQIHLASTFFAFFSILSVVVVAFPVFGYALLHFQLGDVEILAFLFLILIISIFFIVIIFNCTGKEKPIR